MKWLMYLASSLISQALYAQEMHPTLPSRNDKRPEAAQELELESEPGNLEYN